jgi:hypothetical protein
VNIDPDELSVPITPVPPSNIARILMVFVDVVGIAGLIVYCLYISSYLSTFYILMILLIINFNW